MDGSETNVLLLFLMVLTATYSFSVKRNYTHSTQSVVPLAAEDPARGELAGDADAALRSNASQRVASPGAARSRHF